MTQFWLQQINQICMKTEYSIRSTYFEPQTKSKSEVSHLVSPTMSTLQIAALVEGCHWLISRPSLNLHKVGPWVLTFWTRFWSGIHVFPSSRAPENIINLLQFGVLSVINLPRDVVYIWTCVTRESEAFLSLFHD